LRTLGQAAYITPDSHPLKSYFGTTLSNNFAHYNTVYVTANPNQLGIIDGTETNEYKPIAYDTLQGIKTGIAPWQDDFFTWSMGYLAELAYADAQPILLWKSKFPVGRMTDPGYCWIAGAVYNLAVRATETSPVYGSFAESYAATVQTLTATDGTKFIDTTCASQAQADWLSQSVNTVFSTGTYKAGEMTGYSSSATGYPSNMQPALAVAVASGIANAQAAWDIFNSRTVKPDYSAQPQFAIVPR